MAKKVFQEKVKVIANLKISQNYFKIALDSGKIFSNASPGQFVMLRLSEASEPLLRRPLGIHSLKGKTTEILYEVVGPGTEILSHKKTGEYLDVIGPLGNGFYWQSPGHQVTRSPVLVAGGMGVAPLLFLAEKLAQRTAYKRLPAGAGEAQRKTLILIGGKTKAHILCEKEFKKLGCEVKISTDDGSRGFRGKVTDLLKHTLRTSASPAPAGRHNAERITLYACGPRPMLKEICSLSKKQNIPAQVSLEEHMACGIGACFGCAINTTEGFKRACKDGPVFNAGEII